jgi:predicted nucleic acid-binding protein
MIDRAFVDTNVFVYLFDRDAPAKRARAATLLEAGAETMVVSTQVLQEFYVTVTRKLGKPLPELDAEAAVRRLAALSVVDTDADLVLAAVAGSRRYRLSFWDALIVEAALRAECRRLLTEDLQHGRRFADLTVENPFLGA